MTLKLNTYFTTDITKCRHRTKPMTSKKKQSTIVDCVSTQSHGTVEEYAAMDAIYGTTNPA